MPGDEIIASYVKQGDSHSLNLLVERHHRPLLGYLFRMTAGNKTLAEDLVQETFLKMLRSIGQYHSGRPFKPWLYAIATNLARDHYKKAEVRQSVSVPDETLEMMGTNWTNLLEDEIFARDEQQQVSQAVMNLPQAQRETLILRYYQELSLSEIALVLNIPVGTVKSRLSVGLNRLRTALQEVN